MSTLTTEARNSAFSSEATSRISGRRGSYLIRNHIRLAILARQILIGILIAGKRLRRRIEYQLAPRPERNVRQVAQCGRHVPFENLAVEILAFPRSHAVDEVLEMAHPGLL